MASKEVETDNKNYYVNHKIINYFSQNVPQCLGTQGLQASYPKITHNLRIHVFTLVNIEGMYWLAESLRE